MRNRMVIEVVLPEGQFEQEITFYIPTHVEPDPVNKHQAFLVVDGETTIANFKVAVVQGLRDLANKIERTEHG